MPSYFDRDECDLYLEHMKRTMDWIEEKMREEQVDRRGVIGVEARWLQQLIAENVAHYRTAQSLMRRLAELAHYGNQRIEPSFFVPPEGSKS